MNSRTAHKGRPLRPPVHPNKLREYRQRAGMTQEQLAERLGVSQVNVSVAERTGKGLGNDTWFRLADLFNVDPRILRGWSAEKDETAENDESAPLSV